MEEFKPGQVISPQGDAPAASDQPVASPVPPAATPQPQRPTEQIPNVPPPTQGNEPQPLQATVGTPEPVLHETRSQRESLVSPESVESDGWQFHQESGSVAAHTTTLPAEGVSWTAAEFVAHDKDGGWYGILAIGGVLGAILVYWLTKDKITTGIIAFAVLAFGFLAARKPKQQTYAIDYAGLHVGRRSYSLQSFKSFSVAEEGQSASIVFMPLKRFMPPLTIYLSSDSEEKVVALLSQLLPFEQHRQDAVDSIMKRIRF